MKSVVIGTAGHVDHGKSALVRALTGIDPDRLKEEQERGITIDLGFAHCEIGGINFAFVDVPGHERFVKNMLAGVGGIDAVLLVVAADESVMPQTREHFEICRLLQVGRGLVALTKSDLVDEETLELARLEVRELVDGSALAGQPVVPVSAKTGWGLTELRDALVTVGRSAEERPVGGATRLPIDRVFSMRGFGTVVTGTLVSGQVWQDEELLLLPSGRRVKIRGLQVHGRKQPTVAAGHRTALNLGGVEVADIARGETLVTPGAFEPTRALDAVIEVVDGATPLRHGARVRFHYGTSEVLGRLTLGEGAQIEPGASAYVRLRLESPAVVTRGDRFILRVYSPPATIAGGRVLDPRPPRGGVRTRAARVRFERLDDTVAPRGADEVVFVMTEESGAAGFPVAALTWRAGVSPAEADGCAARLPGSAELRLIDGVLVASAVVDALREKLLAALAEHHRTQPLSEGLPREEARERLFPRAHPAVFQRVLDDLVADGKLVARDRLALAAHRVSLTPQEERAREAIERTFREAALRPPDPGTVAAAAALPQDVVDRMMSLLARQKVLVKVDTLFFHEDALRRLRNEVAALKAASSQPVEIDVAAFKDRYGVTRKFAIPLLEYLDRERITRRVGDRRVVL